MTTEEFKERRHPISCPYCGTQMVCMNKFTAAFKTLAGIFVWYICPRRKGEVGCGHTMPIEIQPVKSRLVKEEEESKE
jgi:hypothetical protein